MNEHGCVGELYITGNGLHMAMGHSCQPPGEEEQTELCLSLTLDGKFLRGRDPVSGLAHLEHALLYLACSRYPGVLAGLR